MITQINIVPFTDVVLVLLIIFMVTAKFLGPDSSLDLRLPATAAAQPRNEPLSGIVVTILANGSTYVDQQAVADKDLVRSLAGRASEKRTRLVIVRADRAVPYERVAHAIDSAKLAGCNDLALATELNLGSAPAAAGVR